ncbi:zinc ABC transporter substrate-binding protein [Marinimicrococcus flavescens]|uniref:High-affinity zinc uptake system protein ZnuA n=1 Tax=Marinimicrococcus flavescens TaxID=3031815 RepID=A0AAP3XSL1_9PROT|nr:zinc ABC transporter substrate-binding protein [Marinimicrococcus flavescens]
MVRTVSRAVLLGCWAMLAAPAGAAEPAAAPPRVVASVQPVHALATRLMEGAGEPVLLVRPGSSPHGYQLRPSEASALERADLVFWVGEPLETFLIRPLANLPEKARVLALAGAPGMELLATREGGLWAPHDHDDHAHAGQHGDHDDHAHAEPHGDDDEGAVDGHVWLAPHNARAMAAAMADALIAADPARADLYGKNAAALDARLITLEEELRAALEPVRERPFIVFHDAFGYLEHAFGLTAAGSITVSPDRPPGARRLMELRAAIEERDAVCVFAEPQTPSRLVQTVVEGTGAGTGELDPLGTATVAPGGDAYEELMRRNAAELVRCLSGAG